MSTFNKVFCEDLYLKGVKLNLSGTYESKFKEVSITDATASTYDLPTPQSVLDEGRAGLVVYQNATPTTNTDIHQNSDPADVIVKFYGPQPDGSFGGPQKVVLVSNAAGTKWLTSA